MADPKRIYEIRCPVHGLIPYSDWEREVINQPAFQRLRRIRQLGWTDYVYPGAMHTRFEHSLGVMHMAGLLFDAVVQRSADVLESELKLGGGELCRDRQLVRFAALLHDTGHGPFSHAAEDLLPTDAKGKHYKHEAYSAAVVRHVLKDAIEGHPLNADLGINADEVASLLGGKASAPGGSLFWRQLIDGQMDADRMDYLLRDSMHAGVDYGRYDWRRLLNTVQVVRPDQERPRLGVAEGGVHAAEALVLARYYMFAQVYFHKTRVAYDHHIQGALRAILIDGAPDGAFPPPTPQAIAEYLEWDDWRVLGRLADGKSGGEHGDRLRQRNHYRQVYRTPESPGGGDQKAFRLIEQSLRNCDLVAVAVPSTTSAYKLEASDLSVATDDAFRPVLPLSECSPIVRNLNQHPLRINRLYARPEHAAENTRPDRQAAGRRLMRTHTSETRIAILARMVRRAPSTALGRTQVMKLFYFLQELKGVPLGYDFRLFNYGPFDSEVLSDLSYACGDGAVVEETVIYPRGYGYAIKPGPNAERLDDELAANQRDLALRVDEVVREFGGLSASELELRSTVFFVDREFEDAGQELTADDLVDRVHRIKPHFDAPAVRSRVSEMAMQGQLRHLSACTERFRQFFCT